MTQTRLAPSPIGAALAPAEQYQAFLAPYAASPPEHLLLINPPQVPKEYFDPEIAKLCRYFIYPPTGLLYIASVAAERAPQLSVRILDLNYELLKAAQEDAAFDFDRIWQTLLAAEIKQHPRLLVGISCMFSPNLASSFAIAAYVRALAPAALQLIGGVQATYSYEEILTQSACDLVVRREGEVQFATLLAGLIDGDREQIPWGAAMRLPDQRLLVLDEQGPTINPQYDLRPAYDLIDIGAYSRYGSMGAFSRYTGLDKPFSAILSNRGCRARCTFCTVRNFNGFGVRQREVQDVIDEIKYLWHEKGIRQIDWLDDDLLFNEKRAIELFKGLSEQLPELEWICNNGLIAFASTDEVLHWMVQSGLKAFTIGIESGNSAMLTQIKKPATKPRLREAKKRFDQYPEVLATANFIIGFPNETFAEMLDTFELALELQLDWAKIFICQPLKGTEMFSAFQSLGDSRVDYRTSQDFNPGRTKLKSEFLNSSNQDLEQTLKYGMDVFTLPPDCVPNQDQIKEIWLTFNLIVNVLRNRNLTPSGNPAKGVKWVESIFDAYPYDISLCAYLAYGYKLLGKAEKGAFYDRAFDDILTNSSYWQHRARQFPELWRLVHRQPDIVVPHAKTSV